MITHFDIDHMVSENLSLTGLVDVYEEMCGKREGPFILYYVIRGMLDKTTTAGEKTS